MPFTWNLLAYNYCCIPRNDTKILWSKSLSINRGTTSGEMLNLINPIWSWKQVPFMAADSKWRQWRIQGRGPPPIFRPNWGPKCGKKIFFETGRARLISGSEIVRWSDCCKSYVISMEFFRVESHTSLRRNVLSGQERRLTVYSQQAMNWFDPHRGSIDRKNIHNCFLDTRETYIYSSCVQNNWKIKIKVGFKPIVQFLVPLMTWRISRNGRLKTKCSSIPRKRRRYLEKRYNISLPRKQQAYNYAMTLQISTNYRITSYWV